MGATELTNAELKLVLTLDEARAAIDGIAEEQERRRGSQQPTFAPPDEVQVVRPSMGRSAATGQPEEAPATPGGDARATFAPPEPTSAGAEVGDVERAIAGARSVASRAQAVGSFLLGPSSAEAVSVASHLSRSAGASAEAWGLAGAGPAGIAAAAVIAGTPGYMGSIAPALRGVAAAGGPLTRKAADVALFGVAGAVFGSEKILETYNKIAAHLDAIGDVKEVLGGMAVAQLAANGRVNSTIAKVWGGPIYGAAVDRQFEERERSRITTEVRSEAVTRLIGGAILSQFQGHR